MDDRESHQYTNPGWHYQNGFGLAGSGESGVGQLSRVELL
jgi:hypothetical protein